MFRLLGKVVLKIWGFRVTGVIPRHLNKKIFAVVPHTSNWDFILGIATRLAHKFEVQYVAKSSLFKWPYGWFFKALGGIPVNRKKSTNFVDSVVEEIGRREKVSIAIAPEGTRKKVKKLKSGFYYIAKLSGIPIVLVKFDYQNKEVHFGEPFYPSDNEKEDLDYIYKYFEGVLGKIPKYSFGADI